MEQSSLNIEQKVVARAIVMPELRGITGASLVQKLCFFFNVIARFLKTSEEKTRAL